MSLKPKVDDHRGNKVVVVLPGTVDEIIPAFTPAIGHNQTEKVQIAVEGAEALYREIRVDNTLQDEAGNAVSLKLGAEVEVTIEATSEVTIPHKKTESKDLARPTPLANEKKSTQVGLITLRRAGAE
jgi:hypothetical protein